MTAAPEKAVVQIVGLGHFHLQVNGRRAGDAAINQAWSQYDKTIYFVELDIAPLLQAGPNALGVMLGNSFWFNPPAPAGRYHKQGAETDFGPQFLLWLKADITGADGSVVRVVSDETWKTDAGPVTFSHIFGGEDYDARLEQPGWDLPGFDDRSWQAAAAVAAPRAKLEKQFWPPIREQEVFPIKEVKQGGPGVFHVFFGQNASGILRFTVEGAQGQSFTAQPSEYRTEAGEFMKPRWGGAPILFHYALKGGGPETHQWLFQYQGFQAVEITGAVPAGQPNPDGLPVIQHMELVHTRVDLTPVGEFRGSAALHNDIHTLVDWAMRSNMADVMTDCPHREKLGWLECAHLMAPSFSYRFDTRDWFAKIARDIRDAQEPSGRILTVAPSYPGTRFPDAFHWTVEWGAAGVLTPWHHYTWYGDVAILRDNYECMRRFVDYVASASTDGIAPGGLGDWYDYGHGQPPGPSRFTPTELTATAVQVMCIDAVIAAAEVLEKQEDVRTYRELREKTAAAYLRRFYDPQTRTFAHKDSPQCAHTISLVADLVPKADREAVLQAVILDLQQRDWQQTPGDIGHRYFIQALAEAGRSDVLHRVYSRRGLGSYGGILAKGLTSMPETWDAMTDGYQSHNHCMLGHIMEWYYAYVAGIRQQPGSVGWKRILIAPAPFDVNLALADKPPVARERTDSSSVVQERTDKSPVAQDGPVQEGMTQAQAVFTSPAGRIVSKWTVINKQFLLEAEIPEGTTADLVAPDGTRKQVGPGRHTLIGNLRP